MSRGGVVLALLLALALVGCVEQSSDSLERKVAKLEAERDELRADFDALHERARKQSILVHEAQVAAACDYLIELCPDSMTRLGRAALATGEYSGGGVLFWLLVAAKFSAYLAACVVFFVLAWVLPHRAWLWLVAPRRADVDAARAAISRARGEAAAAQEAVRAAEQRREALEDEIEDAHETLREALENIAEAEAELAKLRAAREAVSGL